MFLLAAAIVLATLLVFKGVKIFNYLDHMAGIMEMIPGPTPYPFVGNLFQFGLKPAGKFANDNRLAIFMNCFCKGEIIANCKLMANKLNTASNLGFTCQIRIAM